MKYTVKVKQYEIHVAEHEIEIEGDIPRERAAAIGVAKVALAGMFVPPSGTVVEEKGDDCEVEFDEVSTMSWAPLRVSGISNAALFDELVATMADARIQPTMSHGLIAVQSIQSVKVTKRRK